MKALVKFILPNIIPSFIHSYAVSINSISFFNVGLLFILIGYAIPFFINITLESLTCNI